MVKKLMGACALVCTAAVVAGCGSASGDEGRAGSVSVGSLGKSSLKATSLDGVALYAEWDADKASGADRFVGDKETAPQMLTATCFGQYPDLRVKVQGPDEAELSAVSGEKTMSVRFAELGPFDITPDPQHYKWGPTGVDLAINMSAKSDRTDYVLPEDSGIARGSIVVRMLVTCPMASSD